MMCGRVIWRELDRALELVAHRRGILGGVFRHHSVRSNSFSAQHVRVEVMDQVTLRRGRRLLQILLCVRITALANVEQTERRIRRNKTRIESDGLFEVTFGLNVTTLMEQQVAEIEVCLAVRERGALRRGV